MENSWRTSGSKISSVEVYFEDCSKKDVTLNHYKKVRTINKQTEIDWELMNITSKQLSCHSVILTVIFLI